jgi:hypothetical protein
MSVKLRFSSASVTRVVLAKVGNPQRDEPLETSREAYSVTDEDKEVLTPLFLKPFKNLAAHRFAHHSSLDQHEVNHCAKAIFDSPTLKLHPRSVELARRLYAKSTHPNIKAGDLCIALIEDIEVEDKLVNAICILKSESVVPFLSISAEDGDLRLATTHGINPEKIDKGCLILDHSAQTGYLVYTFDRSGGESRFWVREFLGVQVIPDSAYLTQTYADLAVSYMEKERPLDTPPEANCADVREAIAFFDEREHFDLQEFEQKILKTPEAVEKFAEHRARVEEEQGLALETSFEIEPKQVKKAKKRVAAVIKLDTGVEVHVKPGYETDFEPVIERGFDDDRGLNYIKVFYNEVFMNNK